MKLMAKKPYTTVGTPARTSRAGFTVARRASGAYSLRYMAVNIPSGKATAIAIPAISTVAESSGRAPKLLLAKSGLHSVPVKNSMMDTSPKNGTASTSKMTTMPTVVTTESTAHKNKNAMMGASRNLRRGRRPVRQLRGEKPMPASFVAMASYPFWFSLKFTRSTFLAMTSCVAPAGDLLVDSIQCFGDGGACFYGVEDGPRHPVGYPVLAPFVYRRR